MNNSELDQSGSKGGARARYLLVALGILLFGFMHWFYYSWFLVDGCLDRGGRWDYEARRCEGARD